MASSDFIYDGQTEEYPTDNSRDLSNRSRHQFVSDVGVSFLDYNERLKKEIDYWKKLACQNEMTTLPNRRAFYFIIDAYLNKADRQSESVIFFYIDINRFKSINDAYGHTIGDEVLKELGHRLNKVFTGMVFHFSGDEFVIVHRYHKDPCLPVAAIQEVCSASFLTSSGKIDVSISIGASLYPMQSTDVSTLLDYADSAMYTSKRGLNKSCSFYQE